MSTISWIHISDLHFRPTNHWEANIVLRPLIKDVKDQIEQQKLDLNFAVVTGDIAFQADEKEYALAQEFFDEFLNAAELSKDRLFMVPGNHDISRDMITTGNRIIARSLDNRKSLYEVLSNNNDRRLILLKFLRYSKFINTFFKRIFSFNDENFYFTHCFKADGIKIAILGLNSALLSMDDSDRGRLVLSEYQTRNALKATKKADISIAIMHHPFSWFNDFDASDCEHLLMNACDFILHGHLHKAGILNIATPDAQAMIIAAGACYETRQSLNSYNIVTLDPNTGEGNIHLRCYSDSQGGCWVADNMTFEKVENGQFAFKIKPKAAINPLASYLVELAMELRPWQGIGLESPINIEDIFISNVLFEKALNEEKTYDESQITSDFFIKRKKIFIEAPAGMGKSTLLKHWAIQFAEKGIADQKIPIFLPLSYVESKCIDSLNWSLSLIELASMRFSLVLPQSSDSLKRALSKAIADGNAIILLDGFDEVSDNNRHNMKNWIDYARSEASECPMVITSRPPIFDQRFDHFSKLSLQPFDASRQKRFITKWFKGVSQPDNTEEIYKILQSSHKYRIRGVSGNPLFLTMICVEYSKSGSLPNTQAELINKFTRLLVFNYTTPITSTFAPSLKLQVLELVADHFYEKYQNDFSEDELIDLIENNYPDLESPYQLIKEISKYTGLIIRNRYGYWHFLHLLFQEFFTASFHIRQNRMGIDQSEWLGKIRFARGDRYVNIKKYYTNLSQTEQTK